MADQYQNFPFPTMGSGWHGDTIAPQTLVNPSLASRTGTGISSTAANAGPGGATNQTPSWSISDVWPGGVPGGPGMGPGISGTGPSPFSGVWTGPGGATNTAAPWSFKNDTMTNGVLDNPANTVAPGNMSMVPGANPLGATRGPNSASSNQPADLGLASRDPAFLQSIANRVLPGAQMNQGGGGNIPPWLIPAMNSLAGMNFSGGGMGNQQPQMQAPSSGLLAVGPGGPMPVQNAFEAAQMKARADADWNARIAGGTVGPNWGNPDFLSGVGKWPAPRPEAYGMPRQQSGWTM